MGSLVRVSRIIPFYTLTPLNKKNRRGRESARVRIRKVNSPSFFIPPPLAFPFEAFKSSTRNIKNPPPPPPPPPHTTELPYQKFNFFLPPPPTLSFLHYFDHIIAGLGEQPGNSQLYKCWWIVDPHSGDTMVLQRTPRDGPFNNKLYFSIQL